MNKPVSVPPNPAASRDDTPLWQQLQQVAVVMQKVEAGASATTALEAVPAAIRPGVQALVFETLRGLGVGRVLCRQLVQRRPAPLLQALLHSALVLAWQAGEQREDGRGYTDFTLVSQAVEAAKRHPKLRHSAAMVNAVLRRYLREQPALRQAVQQASPQGDPALLNVPEWWLQRLQRDHGAEAATALIHHGQRAAPMTLRVNARHMSADAYLEQQLRPAGLDGWRQGAYGIVLQRACPVQQLPGFAEGWVSVQDMAAQLAAPLLLEALPQGQPLRLLDACAAPGGKTAHLLELGDHEVLALDQDPQRCERIHATLQRLQLPAEVRAVDAAEVERWWDGRLFDGILLDAPCTASGIVRRHPDVPWLRRASDVPQLAAAQVRLLQALWPLLKPGGRLLYCTCSVFREEGDAQIEAFLLHHNDALRLPAPGHLIPMGVSGTPRLMDNGVAGDTAVTGQMDHDGFYYALLAKRD